jgi:hypothetical protein
LDGVLSAEDEHCLTPLFWSHGLPYGEVILNMNCRLALGGRTRPHHTTGDGVASGRRAFTKAALQQMFDELSLHVLGHSCTTHLLEADYDCLFVQQQLGHCCASRRSLSTSVSSDVKHGLIVETTGPVDRLVLQP